jgi:hypothetical protein
MMDEGSTGSLDPTAVPKGPGPGHIAIQSALEEFRRSVEVERLPDLAGQTLADWLQNHPGVKDRAALPIAEDEFTTPSMTGTAVSSDPAPTRWNPGISPFDRKRSMKR